MKQTILSAIAVIGLATGAFGQQLILDNLSGNGSSSATSLGLVYEKVGATTTVFDGNSYNLGVTVLLGTSVGSLTTIGTYTPLTDSKGYTGAATGQFQLGAGGAAITVPGAAAGQVAFVQLLIWDYDSPNSTGTYSSYAAAVAGGDYTASVTFQNGTSNPSAGPPVPPPDFTGMPSVTLMNVPEPTTFAIAGLGIASLLAFRRRS